MSTQTAAELADCQCEYGKIFWMLHKYGHSGAKAAEIIIDAKRDDWFAITWIRHVRSVHREHSNQRL